MANTHQCSDLTEDTYPLHSLDDHKSNRSFVHWIMRFNDVLEPNKLNSALSRLLDIGDWKKLGGRLRFKKNGRLEVYFPKSPKAQLSKVFFTHQSFDMNIEVHPVACRMPMETNGPSAQPVMSDFRPFIARPNFPSLNDLVQQNQAMISLHVTSFNDSTIIGLAWPHVLMDVLGGQALLIGWSAVLAGQEDQVPTVFGAREDILRDKEVISDDETQEALKIEPRRLQGGSLLLFHLRLLWDRFWGCSRERRVIFLPKACFKTLEAQVQADLAEVTQGFDTKPFISENDILTAWAVRAVASESNPRPITVLSLLNARFRIPKLLKSTGVFVQNMVIASFAFLPAPVAAGSMGSIALSHREHLAEQGTEKQTTAFLRSVIQDIESTRRPRLAFGTSDSVTILINNVMKANLMTTLNFEAAVVRKGDVSDTRKNPPGTMTSYYNEALDGALDFFDVCLMLGKDYSGNYWLMGNFLPRAWAKIEEDLKTWSVANLNN
ncbi:hypothetical protein N7462_001027 [Penicillium macrosclerotiorum]|uniref:uncharacterized protein n=1 Tax=Penicillium macrosclerotiorum TaxID=303699 RepID=UPI002547DFD4|nr:uncharacterized protein N7462_001027 [Penicillium macrosclerotiorum]KAJ5699022.1 hypothetical protein N7462_001027 [Penicillium macrosclerotiorum]